MTTPLIIAARNESDYIGETLRCLPTSVEPIVVINDSHDETAATAEKFGARVLESEPGKTCAVQCGLLALGKQALGPVLYLDADTQPLFPAHWPEAMIRGLGQEAYTGSGLYVASDGPVLQRTVISGLRVANAFKKIAAGELYVSGANMVTRLQTADKLEAILALDNYWVGEDVARAEAVSTEVPAIAILNVYAAVKTSSRYLGQPLAMMMMGRQKALEVVERNRLKRSIPGTITYEPGRVTVAQTEK